MSDLLARFDAIMAYTLDAGARTTEELAWPDLTTALLVLVDEERRLAPLPSCSDAELDASRFAVYAWVDETLLSSKRKDALLWMAVSLQQRFFQTSNAGMEFFARLNRLLAEPETGDPSLSPLPSLSSLPSSQAQGAAPGGHLPASGLPLPVQTEASLGRGGSTAPLKELPARLAAWKAAVAGSACPAQGAGRGRGTGAAAGTGIGAGSSDKARHHSRAAVIRVYAACLLYGFRGALGRPEYETVRRELLPLCADLVAPPDIWPLALRELADTPRRATASQHWKTLFVRLEPFLHIVLPALICLGFYVYCADIVSAIKLPDLNGL